MFTCYRVRAGFPHGFQLALKFLSLGYFISRINLFNLVFLECWCHYQNFPIYFWDRVSCSPVKDGFECLIFLPPPSHVALLAWNSLVDQAGLELGLLLWPPPRKCWHVPPWLFPLFSFSAFSCQCWSPSPSPTWYSILIPYWELSTECLSYLEASTRQTLSRFPQPFFSSIRINKSLISWKLLHLPQYTIMT